MEDEKNNVNTAKTMEETDEKCPSCGGTMSYDPAEKQLVCGYCGAKSNFEEPVPDIAQEINIDLAEDYANHDWGAAVKSVICKSCGAESIYDSLQIADICPYCGSNLVVEAGDADAMAPGGVCGFAVTVKQAAEKFKKWIKRRIFAPKEVRKGSVPDSFKGVYLPYWTFDTATSTAYTARYGRTRTVTVKGKTHTHVDWYRTSGDYQKTFDDLLISGTDRYDKKSMAKIEPFDTASGKVYKPEYIAGFAAERYSVGLNDAWQRGREKIKDILKDNIESYIRKTQCADRVDSLRMSVDYSDVKFKYLLLPIWLSSFSYKGKIYNFMVNGQTGKVGGRAPVSGWKVALAVIFGLALAGLIIWLVAEFGGDSQVYIDF